MKFGGLSICPLWAAAGILVIFSSISDAGDFIRVKKTDELVKLQTALFTYEKEGERVDLIGAVHLADRQYYEFLNDYFKKYDVLLFEMVGGENLGVAAKVELVQKEQEKITEVESAVTAEGDLEPAEDSLAGLGALYGSMEKALGLTGQGEVINYLAENFVHADLTLNEFQAPQKERGESLLSFILQTRLDAEPMENEPNQLRLLGGLLSGRSDLVKLDVMDTMAAGDEQIGTNVGENVIIFDRNAKCLEVLDKQLEAGVKKIGVFYGAAHLPDLERRLVERGFTRKSSKWLNAWVVKKK